ncbi:hypothetical protein [Streptomyces sp. NPDC001137]|uniref:hypothetical protein n=1 Tax=Streptomyces sp. NPDC001137 TaxID=3154378 RepID=UPI003328E4AD
MILVKSKSNHRSIPCYSFVVRETVRHSKLSGKSKPELRLNTEDRSRFGAPAEVGDCRQGCPTFSIDRLAGDLL